MRKPISVRPQDSLGCSVAATAVVIAIKQAYPDREVAVFTAFPEIFEHLGVAIQSSTAQDSWDVDLSGYLAKRPHNVSPYRPMYIHMLELAEEQLNCKLERPLPRIQLTTEERAWAQTEAKRFGRPFIWFQTKTNSENKNWPECNWDFVHKKLENDFAIIDLSQKKYSLRQSLALLPLAVAGVTGDTFLLHGAAAVGAKNVFVIIGSSRPEVTAYPGQTPLYVQSSCAIQPCGMHGYAKGCKPEDESKFIGHEKTRCVTDDYRCMKAIAPEVVLARVRSAISKV